MNDTHSSKSIKLSAIGRLATLLSPEVRGLIRLGRENGWDFALLGRAPLPRNPVRMGDWLIIPAYQDTSLIPVSAYQRIQMIFAAGLRPVGFVVVHEAPKLLSAATQNQLGIFKTSLLSPELKSALKVASGVLGVVGAGLVTVAGFAIMAMAIIALAAVLLVPVSLVMGAAMVDPILIAVTKEGFWIEIDRWNRQG